MINVFDALQYPFQDRQWFQKLLIIVALLFIPVIGWLVLSGYALRATRDLLHGERGLPDHDDWSGDLARGLGALIGLLFYMIPSSIMGAMQAALDQGILSCLACCLGFLQMLYGLFILPFQFSALAHYAATEDINVFLDLRGRWADVSKNINDVLMLVLNLVVIYVIILGTVGVGVLMCCVPGLLAIAASSLVNAHLLAQWGRVLGLDPYYKPKHGV